MKPVTRNIDPASAYDLLRRVPRACIGFGGDAGPQAQPVLLDWRDDQYRIGVPQIATLQPSPGQEVVLLVDEGVYYFDLRAIYVRGSVLPVQPASGGAAGYAWFELTPSKTIAWDYGMMREADDER